MFDLETLRAKVPAAFAQNPAIHVSEDYQFIPTIRVIEEMEKYGWVVIHGKQQKVRNPEDKDHTKHTILLRNKDVAASFPALGHMLPTIRIINSHNWACKFYMEYAMLRLACANGLTYEGQEFNSYSIDHGSVIQDIARILGDFSSQSKTIEETNNRWAGIPMEVEQVREFAHEVAKVRFNESPTEEHIRALTYVRRPEDSLSNLFGAWNVIQENALKSDNQIKVNNRKVRAINSIGKEHELNKGIFVVASSYDSSMRR